MIDYQYLQQKYLLASYPNRGLTLVSGNGMYLYDEKGNAYLDLMSNYGVSIFGHMHPILTSALKDQLTKLLALHGSFTNDVRSKASYSLIKHCNGNYNKVYWSNSGAEAVEAAIKFSILATGKHKILTLTGAYHGKTLGALSLTDGDKYRKPFMPSLFEIVRVNYEDKKALHSVDLSHLAGCIIEPIQGDGGGIQQVPLPFIKQLVSMCKKSGVTIIFDEIQTGCGRTGSFLASQKLSVSADIVCLGKGLAGGLPVGATIVTEQIALSIPKAIHTSTFGGNPLICCGVLNVLELLNDKQLNHVQRIGKYFVEKLSTIKSKYIAEVRGHGLMIGIEMKEKRNDLLKALQQERILAIPASENVVRFLPPYIIEKKHIDTVVKTLNKIFKSL